MSLAKKDMRGVFRDLLFVRRFEETCLEVFHDEGIPELPHLSIGQEAVGVGGLFAIRDDDWVVPSLRTRAAILLRVPVEQVIAGMWGTASGPSAGRTTQHHMGSTKHRILGTTGMVGAHLNPAAGAALSSTRLGEDTVILVFFGDGAVQRGEFHTALNFAAVNDLPVVFLVENNGWTEETPVESITAVERLSEFAVHVPSTTVDGQDIERVVDAVGEAVDRARTGGGPSLVEAETCRFRPHAEIMDECRSETELEQARRRDPVDIFRSRVTDAGVLTDDDIDAINDEITATIDEAFEAVAEDPMPEESVMYHVYKDAKIDHHTGTVKR